MRTAGRHLSQACRTGDPATRSHGCTGCGCWCHDRPAPANFRAMVEAAKTSATERRGEAPSVAESGDAK